MLLYAVLAAAFWFPALGGGLYYFRRLVRAAERQAGADSELAVLRTRVAALELALGPGPGSVGVVTSPEHATAERLTSVPAGAPAA